MARKLRIAASAFFGLLTITLCLLWVRSLYRYDRVGVPLFNSGGISIASLTGQISVMRTVSPWNWNFETNLLPEDYAPKPSRQKWRFHSDAQSSVALFPLGSLVAVFAVLSALPWASPTNRFSLRTLLIATTLLAVVLGLGVWLAR